MLEGQLTTVTNMGMTMGQTAMTIENFQMMQDQFNVMKEVSNAQSEMFKVRLLSFVNDQSVNINEFIDLSDKMQDMRDDMDDVQEMLMDGMNVDVDLDEDELDRELADIQLEDFSNPTTAPPISSPQQQGAMPAMPAMPAMTEPDLNESLSRL